MSEIPLASIFPFFLPAIRDYIDGINTLYDSFSNDVNLQQIIQQSFFFLITSIKFTFIYFLSFQWIQDLTYLPILVPQIKLEILKEHLFFQIPQSNFFTFLETPSYANNKFLLGFLNSFFLCLPLSVAHIISVRRLLIQGPAAGIFSSFGTILGQILLLICILFGGRLFISPWFNFQLLNYFFGVCLVISAVHKMVKERRIRRVTISDKSLLIKFFLLNFALAWTEQSCIFQYFGNLTLSAEPTIIEIFSSPTQLQFILTHISYITGIILGSLVFTSVFLFACLKISTFAVGFRSISYTSWIQRLNLSLLLIIISFTCSSIPFYSVDYLLFSNLGFVSQDKNFENTPFIPRMLTDQYPFLLGEIRNFSLDEKTGIDTDVTPFDRSRYLMFNSNDSFEQVNYQGEYAWLTKTQKSLIISRDPSRYTNFATLSEFFGIKKEKPTSESAISAVERFKNKTNINISNLSIDDQNQLNGNLMSDLEIEKSMKKRDSKLELLAYRQRHLNTINEFFHQAINLTFQDRFLPIEQGNKGDLEKNFREKYYSNLLYKVLLNADIDSFLSRQPKSFSLNAKQEKTLFEKRLILANYYDSLRNYNELPYLDEFKTLFSGSKTYADRIYNHQFKGTLKLVRRLFHITLNTFEPQQKQSSNSLNQTNKTNVENLILKFDQPLYKNNSTNKSSVQDKAKNPDNNNSNQSFIEHENTQFQPFVHEEFRSLNKNHETKSNSGFIQLTNPIPFYVGWDEQLRKLVITNRLSPRNSASYSMKFFSKTYSDDYPMLKNSIPKTKTIEFTTWPIPRNILENEEQQPNCSYNILFESIINTPNHLAHNLFTNEQTKKEGRFDIFSFRGLKTFPFNIAKNVGRLDLPLTDVIPYNRGGFVWPGHSNLKFKWKIPGIS